MLQIKLLHVLYTARRDAVGEKVYDTAVTVKNKILAFLRDRQVVPSKILT